MTINTVNYPTPVTVNGFSCANCSQVDQAAAHIDPAHPLSGAYEVNALQDPTRSAADKARIAAHRNSVAAAEIPAYRADASHASSATVTGLIVDRTA
jgi:hypothetical protein